jgi:radical SAM superfamily enzyme YgiQ (UPF0313 family)
MHTEKRELNFLLVMPRIINKTSDGYSFPLGLPYISSALKQAGFRVFTYNLNHYEGDVEELLKHQFEANRIDVLLTGGLSLQYYPIKQITETVKKVAPQITIVVGGGIISGDPAAAMTALEDADIGCIGEGETTVVNICRALQEKTPLEEVNGLIIKKGDGTFFETPEQSEIADIDQISWPDYDGFELEKSFGRSPGVSGLNSTRTLFMLGSRSCPYQCSFCFHTVGQKYRQRSLDSFFEELKYNIEKYNIDFLCVADELFSYNNDRVLEFCERIKGYGIKWWAQFRVDSIDGEILPKIKEAGCQTMAFGLESADNTVLKSMGKNITVEQIDHTLKKVYEAGIFFQGVFIFGDEAETYETAENTLNYYLEHREYKIDLNTITVFPGCRLYKNAIKNGIIKDPAQYLKDGCPQINNTQMTNQEYAVIIKKIMEYPFLETKEMESVKLLRVHEENALVDISGKCVVCGGTITQLEFKLFVANFIGCPQCGQRYNVHTPVEVAERIGRHIEKLSATYQNIAVWGVNYRVFHLFSITEQLNADNVFPIDVSEIKQELVLNKRKVNPPNIIDKKGIKAVVIAVPAYYGLIELQIKHQYPEVEKVIDICDLAGTEADCV